MTQDRVLAFLVLLLGFTGIVLNFIPTGKSKDNSSSDSSSISKSLSLNGDKILVLHLSGVMMDGESESFLGPQESNAVKVRDQLLKAAKDDSVKGVLIRINSPGGAVGISQEIYKAIRKVRTIKPVVASMGDVAASGGYYAASACDLIFANPGTLTGSIGVISHFMNIEGLYGKVGLRDMTIKAGKYKDIGNSARQMTEEEKEILQELVDNTYNQFVNDVYEGRRSNKSIYGQLRKDLTRDDIREVAQGMIYSGQQAQAQEIGLVDQLGGYSEALEQTQRLVKKNSQGKIKKDLQTVDSLGSGKGFKELFDMSSRMAFTQNNIESLMKTQTNPLNSSIFKMKYPIMLLAPEFIDF
ncbi:MAG: signal peptide peptidase SppA [Candidatus Melainabacteria bacterium]|jgi:protease-4